MSWVLLQHEQTSILITIKIVSSICKFCIMAKTYRIPDSTKPIEAYMYVYIDSTHLASSFNCSPVVDKNGIGTAQSVVISFKNSAYHM